MYIDTHCHLDLVSNSIISIKNILQNATSFKISKIVQVSASIEEFTRFFPQFFPFLNYDKNIPQLYFTFGSSPNDLCEIDLSFEKIDQFFTNYFIKDPQSEDEVKNKRLKDFISEKKLIAIGEIGLDYFHNFFDVDKQKIAFINYLNLAKNLNLPVVLHIRDAFDDAINILKDFKVKNIIFHCYSGDIKTTENILKNFSNCFFSFAGNITYKKLYFLIDSLKIIPLNKILLETDAPFLAPSTYRGKDNMPWYIIETYNFISKQLDIKDEELLKIILSNFKNAFLID